jgi:hypothetical protein
MYVDTQKSLVLPFHKHVRIRLLFASNNICVFVETTILGQISLSNKAEFLSYTFGHEEIDFGHSSAPT